MYFVWIRLNTKLKRATCYLLNFLAAALGLPKILAGLILLSYRYRFVPPKTKGVQDFPIEKSRFDQLPVRRGTFSLG